MSSGKVVHVLSGQDYDVYIGRGNRTYDLTHSLYANPYRVGKDGTREEVLTMFEKWMPYSLDDIKELHNKTLACWCADRNGGVLTVDDPVVCHGQILLKLAEEVSCLEEEK